MKPSFLSCWNVLLLLLCCSLVGVLADTIVVSSAARDQSPRAFPWIDFEYLNPGAVERGIVKNTLDANRKPIYCCGDLPSPNKTVHNQTSFNTWFVDSPFTKFISHNLTLTNTAATPRLYSFSSDEYFPFNGKGWDSPAGTDQYPDLKNVKQNFHFCSEAHGRFSYKGGEKFTFTGDDDVFVYINNKLALDLGGVHGASTDSFELDVIAKDFGLSLGINYRFDFFWCERHTKGSDIALTTSIEIFCSYYDWCEQCDGDGQSCCNSGCNDGNKCTNDRCAVMAPPPTCANTPVNCTSPDICHTSTCSPSTGACVLAEVQCADTNPCTIDSCDPLRGGCIHICNLTQCSVELCNTTNGKCFEKPEVCNDNNPCTIDTCQNNATSPDGCVYTEVQCDETICTQYKCIPGQWCVAVGPKDVCNYNNNSYCASAFCDDIAGCINTTRTCLLSTLTSDPDHWIDPYPQFWKTDLSGRKYKDNDCFKAICDTATDKCTVTSRVDMSSSNLIENSCPWLYASTEVKAGVISSGVLAGIIIAAIVFAALAGFGAKKARDHWLRMRESGLGAANNNPIYEESGQNVGNPMYSGVPAGAT